MRRRWRSIMRTRQGLIHRNLTPDSLLIDAVGGHKNYGL